MAGTIDLLEYLRGILQPQDIVNIEEGDSDLDVSGHVQDVFDAAALDLVNNTKGTVRVPAGRYIVKSTVTLPRNVHLLMEGVFVYDDDDDEPILVVGEDDYVNQSILLRLAVERSGTQASDWTSQDNIGIKLVNCNQCGINIGNTNNDVWRVMTVSGAIPWSEWNSDNLRVTLSFQGTTDPKLVGPVQVDVEWFAIRLREQA